MILELNAILKGVISKALPDEKISNIPSAKVCKLICDTTREDKLNQTLLVCYSAFVMEDKVIFYDKFYDLYGYCHNKDEFNFLVLFNNIMLLIDAIQLEKIDKDKKQLVYRIKNKEFIEIFKGIEKELPQVEQSGEYDYFKNKILNIKDIEQTKKELVDYIGSKYKKIADNLAKDLNEDIPTTDIRYIEENAQEIYRD